MVRKQRRKVEEAEFEISRKTDNISTKDSDETISADDIQAIVDDMDDEDLDQLTIKKKDNTGAPTTRPASANINNIPDGLGEGVKTLSYPYRISLPESFQNTLESCLTKKAVSYNINNFGGRVIVVFESSRILGNFVKKLSTQDSTKSKIVLSGISGSIK